MIGRWPCDIVAVDVGNSAIKLAWPLVTNDTEDAGVRTFSALRNRLATENLRAVCKAWNATRPVDRKLTRWRTASVNRPASERLRKTIGNRFPDHVWKELTRTELPFELNIRNSETVGIDRLLGALTINATGAKTVISVDAGSAVTVDLVRDGRFCWTILPGMGCS